MTETQTTHTDAAARERLVAVRHEVAKAVVGQDAAVSGLLVAMLCAVAARRLRPRSTRPPGP